MFSNGRKICAPLEIKILFKTEIEENNNPKLKISELKLGLGLS